MSSVGCRRVAVTTGNRRAALAWAGNGGLVRAGALFAVSFFQLAGHFVLELTVIGVNGSAQRGFGGAALRDALQDARDFAHAVSIANVFGGSQRFGVGDDGLGGREAHEAAFEHIKRDLISGG